MISHGRARKMSCSVSVMVVNAMTEYYDDGRLTMVCLASGEEVCAENPQPERFKGIIRIM